MCSPCSGPNCVYLAMSVLATTVKQLVAMLMAEVEAEEVEELLLRS